MATTETNAHTSKHGHKGLQPLGGGLLLTVAPNREMRGKRSLMQEIPDLIVR